MTKDEALDLALEALEEAHYKVEHKQDAAKREKAITAIKQARALDKKAENARELGLDYEPVLKDNSNYRYDPPVAEPVASAAYDMVDRFLRNNLSSDADYAEYSAALDALYTTPPAAQRQWVGLTDEEINSVRYKRDWTAPWTDTTFARAIEAKLKEQNT